MVPPRLQEASKARAQLQQQMQDAQAQQTQAQQSAVQLQEQLQGTEARLAAAIAVSSSRTQQGCLLSFCFWLLAHAGVHTGRP